MLKAISKFYQELYKLLDSDIELQKLVKVHAVIQKDAASWLLINLLEAEPQDITDKSTCQLLFEICIFTQEVSHKTSLEAADIVRRRLKPQNFTIGQYQVISIKDQKLVWTRSQDLRTIKLSAPYRAFLRQIS